MAVTQQSGVPFSSSQTGQILMDRNLVRSSSFQQTDRSDAHWRSPASQQFLFLADRQVRYSLAVTCQSAVPFSSRQAFHGQSVTYFSSFFSQQTYRSDTHGRSPTSQQFLFQQTGAGQMRYSCVVTYQSGVPFLAARQVRYSRAVTY